MPVMNIGHVIVLMFLGGMFMLMRMDSICVRVIMFMRLVVFVTVLMDQCRMNMGMLMFSLISNNAPPIINIAAIINKNDGNSPKIMIESSTPASGAVPYNALVRAAPSPRMERMNSIVLNP